MTFHPDPDGAILRAFAVTHPQFVTQTVLATIWKVTRKDGSAAALKYYTDPDMSDERPGFALLDALDGEGAARLYGMHGGAALLEWLEGSSLGDLSRDGADREADARLVATACDLHRKPIEVLPNWRPLSDWCAALGDGTDPEGATDQTRHNLQQSRALAATLLANQTDIRPLHGDLHHDNVIASPRGDLAFDAKGIVGDRAYEMAAGFLNPVGADAFVQEPARIKERSQSWGQAFDVAPTKLLNWACVHAALSAVWHLRDGGVPDMTMLNLLWQVRDALE